MSGSLTCTQVISPAIDLIDLKSGRGNVFLESAAPMAKALREDIMHLAHRIERVVLANGIKDENYTPRVPLTELEGLSFDLRTLMARIDREIPLLQLTITASGESLSTSLPTTISPSRLLQASALLIMGDVRFATNPDTSFQVGPTFVLSLYMLYRGHAPCTPEGIGEQTRPPLPTYGLGPGERKPIWQEVMHKARVRLLRTPFPDHKAYNYDLEIVQDREDGRAHEDEPPDNRSQRIAIDEISKIFYTDAGKVLNLGNEDTSAGSPVLLLKREIRTPHGDSIRVSNADAQTTEVVDDQAAVDRQLLEESGYQGSRKSSKCIYNAGDNSSFDFGPQLDPEWIAIEMYDGDDASLVDSDSGDASCDETSQLDEIVSVATSTMPSLNCESGPHSQPPASSAEPPEDATLPLIHRLSLHTRRKNNQPPPEGVTDGINPESPLGAITTSLSLLEMLIRLASLQGYQQTSHLAIPDHILTFFLEEASSTGLTGHSREKTRVETKNKVGFDPFLDRTG